MSTLVHPVTRYLVEVTVSVEVTMRDHMTFTDAEVREHLGIDGHGPLDPEQIEEFVLEKFDLQNADIIEHDESGMSVDDITFGPTETVMQAPPEFVPLPGLEGDLGT